MAREAGKLKYKGGPKRGMGGALVPGPQQDLCDQHPPLVPGLHVLIYPHLTFPGG
jgi:hypothetical protein